MKLRGLFPSLGAGGSLIAAAACAFALLGGLLAFRGEKPATAEANSGSVVMPGGTLGVQTSSPGAVEGVVTLAAAAQETARPQPAPRRDQPRGSVRRGGTRTPPPPAATNPSPPADTPATDAPAPAPRPTPAPDAPDTPAAPTAPVIPRGTVQRTVEETRGAVQPIVDTVPDPVQAPVERVADAVEDVAGTVDETVDGLTGGLLPPD
jgi:hypothetical protein